MQHCYSIIKYKLNFFLGIIKLKYPVIDFPILPYRFTSLNQYLSNFIKNIHVKIFKKYVIF